MLSLPRRARLILLAVPLSLLVWTVGLSTSASSVAEAATSGFGAPVELPGPADSVLEAVSCTGAGDCTAVG